MLEQNERWAEALPYRKLTTELDPMNWNVWMAYARDLENTGDKVGAKFALNKVLEFTNDPKFIDPFEDISIILDLSKKKN